MIPLDQDRLAAALEGRYRIESPLGEGGMATVYLAEDLKHGRMVAVKVLKPELAAVVGAERFLAEIRTTATLQHPHILPLFDSGEADGFLFYVMPAMGGESLQDRLQREKQLPLDEALTLTKALASALDHAHRSGVIHRDIKPGNVLLHDGQPVLADFGIALAVTGVSGERLTTAGVSAGTPSYMSPEQASGDQELTARSDVYALACVLYEMLAGDPPHTASTFHAILARILTEEPRPITEVRKSVPAHVAAALTKALEKVPADRFGSAEAFRAALDDEAFRYSSEPAAPDVAAATAGGRPTLAALLGDLRVVGGLVGVLLLGLWAGLTLGAAQGGSAPVFGAITNWRQVTFGGAVGPPAISPDGSFLAHVDGGSASGARRRLLLVDLTNGDELEPHPGLTRPRAPKWHPDGRRVTFYADGALDSVPGVYTMSQFGQDPRLLLPGGSDVYSWSSDGERLAVFEDDQLYLLSVGETDLSADTIVLPISTGPDAAEWSPVDDLLAITIRDFVVARSDLYVVTTDGRVTDSLPDVDGAAWLSDGRSLMYRAEAADELRVIGVDAEGLLVGEPATALTLPGGVGAWAYDAGSERLVVTRGEFQAHAYRVALDGDAAVPERFTSGTADYMAPMVSPDGSRVAYVRAAGTSTDIYHRSARGGDERRLTRVGSIGNIGAWSPDSDAIAFSVPTDSGFVVMTVGLDGGSATQVGGRRSTEQIDYRPITWGPDGQLAYLTSDVADLFVVDLRSGEGHDLLGAKDHPNQTRWMPQFSPDGGMIAMYSSVPGERGIQLIDVNDPSQRPMIVEGRFVPLRWLSMDTLAIVVDRAEIYALNVVDGGRRLLGAPPDDCYTSDISPDGRVAYCEMREQFSDLWLARANLSR